MTIFNIEQTIEPAASVLAKGFLAEANQQFEDQLQRAYDSVDRFWRRNKDAKGQPIITASETDPQPTGIEILQAMGPHAQAIIVVAYKRVEMLLGIQAALGLSGIVDVARCLSPYECTFHPDGSLDSYTLRS